MHKNVLFLWSLIVLLLIIPMAWGDESGTYENDNANIILLKAGPIHTDIVSTANDQEIDENPAASIASYSIDTTETNDNPGSYYIVQFNGPVLEEWKGELAGTGAVLFDYVPNNAFVVRMDPAQKEQVDSLDFVKWTGEYRASYKHQINTGKVATLSMPPSSYDAADLIVLLFDESESQNVLEKIIPMDADIVESSPRILRVRIARDRINDIAAIEGICWIEEYAVPVVFNDVAAGIINVNPVHESYRLNGTGQIVAVCDTGLDTGLNDESMHIDIRGRILDIFDLVGDGAGDQHGHGTHVTGSVLGNGAMLNGQYKGMAPEAMLIFQAAGTDKGALIGVPADLNVLFQQAYDEEARIHINSWGYTGDSGNYSTDSWQVDTFMWNNPDMLLLFSAGNYGVDKNKDGVVDQDSITTPGTAKNCLTVGASENYRPTFTSTYGSSWSFTTNPIFSDYITNNPEGIAAFSSRGPTDDGRIKPDLVAPGTHITSTKSSLSLGTGDYTRMSGTSMATPLVAGAAALTRQYYTEIEKLTTPSAALIKATLINGAHDMTPGQYGTGNYQEIVGRPDYSQGWGRVDVEISLFPEYPKVTAYHDRSAGLVTSQSWEIDYNYIKDGEPLRATLVWTDYPGSPASGKALVNDLDLTVTGSGNTYYGNGAPESINNIEAVEIKSTSYGSYQFTVTGENIPQGPQPFAVVLSFTCDNSVFPAHDSSTSDSMTIIATDVVHPAGVNLSSVSMKVNGSPVPYTNSAINGGYRIQYATSTPFQNGEYNVSVTALTSKRQPFSYGWGFNVVPSPAKSITSFRFNSFDPDVVGVINEASKTITMKVPYGTDVTALVPTIVHTGASISPNSGVARSFSSPVTYTVTAEDGTTQSYTVTVTVAPNPAKSITSFRFNSFDPDVVGVINEASRTIALTVPYGTDVTALVPTIVHNGSSISPKSGVAQNFANPVTYTVTAADGTTQSYTVTVTVAPNPAKSITSFKFNGLDPAVNGNISEAAKTVTLTVPYETSVESLIPTIEHTGVSISPGSEVAQNFTNPVVYIVTAADRTTQSYTVTVTVAPSPAKSITSFKFNGLDPAVNGTINETSKTVALMVPYGTDVTGLIPTIVHNGTSILPKSGVAQNFTNPVVYTVTAPDKTTQEYTVTVKMTAPSTNANLAALTVSKGTLTPTFSSNTVSYNVSVDYTVTSINVTATMSDSKASMVINGQVASSGIAKSIALQPSGNKTTITITLTAEDGTTTESYSINVNRARVPANNANLSGLAVSRGTLSPGFSPATTSYNVSVDHDVAAIDVTATMADANASMKIDSMSANSGVAKTVTLQDAGTQTVINIVVTAEDTTTKKTYTIIVNRAAAPDEEVSYLITVDPATGGTANVTADKSAAKADETVNVTIADIEAGKKLSSVSVTGDSGTVQTKPIISGVSYSFVMPAENVTVEVALTTEQSATAPTTSGGGGGGGGGSTGEKAENILLKDVSSVFVGKDAVRFDFKNPGSDIQYIEYTSLKNSGTITATIEMLKDRSTFAFSSPEGTVYRHVNIWVGKTGYATEANIIDPAIVFRVDNSWISSNNIDPASINLNRHSEGAWSKLPTEQTGSDADFLYFRAATPGFSPFAITGESFENESTLHSTSEALFSTDSAESIAGVLDGSSDPKANGAQAERALPALSVIVTLIIVLFACFLLRKQ
jgi:PGF-pre-PGF domain-containing protein